VGIGKFAGHSNELPNFLKKKDLAAFAFFDYVWNRPSGSTVEAEGA
jgi:hypothetical protein